MESTKALSVKIYSDGADKKSMFEMAQNPLIQGLTTNPTLMRKAGVQNYVAFAKEILQEITQKPISFEVFADDFQEMKRQALEIASWGENVYVKIPVTNSEGCASTNLIHELSHQGVKLNVTAILSLKQVTQVTQALQGGAPSVVSVFAGRIADTGRDPIPLMAAALELCKSADPNIELLWASSREALNIVQADSVGCHIITCTNDLISKMSKFSMDLEKLSLDTVRMFKTDAEAANYSF